MKNKGKFWGAACFGVLALLLILLLCFVDVAPIGPEGTRVGLSRINQAAHGLFGVRMIWYDITDWLGFAALFVAFAFAVAGLAQLIRRKSFFKVDKEILALGGLYLLVIGLYLFFEKVIVNCRPIIMPGCEHPEASFPSSHTMLVCVILGSAMMLMGKYVKNARLRAALRAGCALVIGITVLGRLIAGVHWLTDIVGGLLISASLLLLYAGILEKLKSE